MMYAVHCHGTVQHCWVLKSHPVIIPRIDVPLKERSSFMAAIRPRFDLPNSISENRQTQCWYTTPAHPITLTCVTKHIYFALLRKIRVSDGRSVIMLLDLGRRLPPFVYNSVVEHWYQTAYQHEDLVMQRGYHQLPLSRLHSQDDHLGGELGAVSFHVTGVDSSEKKRNL